MDYHSFVNTWNTVKQRLTYEPSRMPDPFVLYDGTGEEPRRVDDVAHSSETQASVGFRAMLDLAYRLADFMEQTVRVFAHGQAAELAGMGVALKGLEKEWRELAPVTYAYRRAQPGERAFIHAALQDNRNILAELYKLPHNKDIVLRDVSLAKQPAVAGLIVYIDGLVDGIRLDQFILAPLMELQSLAMEDMDSLMKRFIPNGQVRRVNSFEELQTGINSGNAALCLDGFDEALLMDIKGWEHRSVDTPKTEQSIRGSLAGFSENLRINTALIRSILHASDLVTEMIPVGSRGKLNCALMYIDSLVNESLCAEVRRRLRGIATDFVIDSSQLMQFVYDESNSLFPQSISTERPDRAAAGLTEGRLVVILDGNPFAQILPVSFFSFFHSAEDFSVSPGVANFMRILRVVSSLTSIFLPSVYLALSYFHPEAMPTELLLAIAGSRENVPFPAWFEIFVMELSFELIREAGVRIPGVLGSTIGIVGAIIIGQAAVMARVVSPIVVVIVAITGLASFTIPEYRMAQAIRVVRFLMVIVAASSGLVGLAMALLIFLLTLCRMKSFGMPYMAPLAPKTMTTTDIILRSPVYEQEFRPDELNTKDPRRQPKYSRTWMTGSPPEQGGETS